MKEKPTAEQAIRLHQFASKNGPDWKYKLGVLWTTGRDANLPNGHLLRQVRNNLGPEWLNDYEFLSAEQLDTVTQHFLVAAVWADAPEGTHPRVTKKSQEKARRLCRDFIYKNMALFLQAMAREEEGYGAHPDAGSAEAAFGHDLWLTRQRHGVGFWDRKELEAVGLGQCLSAACREAGEVYYEFYRGWMHIT